MSNYKYDRDFYEAMYRTAPLKPEDVKEEILSAVLRFIQDGTRIATIGANPGLVMMSFFHGYQVGRRLRKDIRCSDEEREAVAKLGEELLAKIEREEVESKDEPEIRYLSN